ncbi:MAG: cyclic nucleotide-binding domain-containing protein [Gammaproteobacteria bacterium]|nr:cyclic nucleotide-binding domain-containing protein [Gammaproteobacteria bacterium]
MIASPTATQVDVIQSMLIENPQFIEGDHWRRAHIPAGGAIISQEEDDKSVYLLRSGWARVIGRMAIEGERSVAPGVCDLGPGELFGEVVLFGEERRTASVIAVTECDLWVFNGPRLMAFLEAHPEIGFKFLSLLMRSSIRRLRNTNKKVLSLFAWGLKAHQIEDQLN